MITARRIRTATAVAATAVLLTLAAAIPAHAIDDEGSGSIYPIDRGVITLESQNHWSQPRAVLQETGETYELCDCANAVVASPPSWDIDQQKWRLIQTGENTYRLINVFTGHALQSTSDYSGSGFAIVATPAWWNAPQQEFRIYPWAGVAGQDVVIWGKVAPGHADARLGVSANAYRSYPGVFEVGTSVGWGYWTVTGYTFPAY